MRRSVDTAAIVAKIETFFSPLHKSITMTHTHTQFKIQWCLLLWFVSASPLEESPECTSTSRTTRVWSWTTRVRWRDLPSLDRLPRSVLISGPRLHPMLRLSCKLGYWLLSFFPSVFSFCLFFLFLSRSRCGYYGYMNPLSVHHHIEFRWRERERESEIKRWDGLVRERERLRIL